MHGVATFWVGVKGAGIGAKGAAVAGAIANVDEDLAKGLRAQAIGTPKKLRGAIQTAIGAEETRTAKFMLSAGEELHGIGDQGVRIEMGMSKGLKAPDFLTRLANGTYVFTEVKWPAGDTLKLAGNQVGTAMKQLTSAVTTFKAAPKGKLAKYVRLAVPKGTELLDGYFLEQGKSYFKDKNGKAAACRRAFREAIGGALK